MATPTILQHKPEFIHYERGRIAALEQMKIFKQILLVCGEPRTPQTRGEVAAQEQIRIFQKFMTNEMIQPREPKTRGEVAAQEQIRIFSNILTSL